MLRPEQVMGKAADTIIAHAALDTQPAPKEDRT